MVWRPVVKKASLPPPANPPGSMQGPIQNTDARNVTPVKKLVQLQRQDYSEGGYSSDSFGAHSYKEVVSSPHRRSGGSNAAERVGGNTPSGEMEPFRQCVADCGVIDIDAKGSLFTWNNKQKPEERIYSRIDRFLINKDWRDHMPDLYAHFLPEGLMDHTPCIVSSSKNSQRKCCFKYFNMWGDAKEFLPTVRSNWDKDLMGTSMFRLAKNLKPPLKRLNTEGYNDIEHSTSRLQKQVHDLQEQLGRNPTDIQLLNAEYEASQELKKLSIARDSYLAQKTKQFWMREGDTNSAYFHGILKKRRNGNRVIMIEDMNGKMCDSPE
ncbi:uncharacterized protein LOC141627980 [Silene latifolia]|uniref:uncharacterized protein LOC141627980 n=1 Tax=Silene latifolia TaxID=37657 RepID=UPI003D773FB2